MANILTELKELNDHAALLFYFQWKKNINTVKCTLVKIYIFAWSVINDKTPKKGAKYSLS